MLEIADARQVFKLCRVAASRSSHSHFVQCVNTSRVDSLLMSAACVFITLTDFPDIVWCLCVKKALF